MPIYITKEKIGRDGITSQFMLQGQQYPDSKTKDIERKEDLRPISLMNINRNIFNTILANGIQQSLKTLVLTQVVFILGMPGCFNL